MHSSNASVDFTKIQDLAEGANPCLTSEAFRIDDESLDMFIQGISNHASPNIPSFLEASF